MNTEFLVVQIDNHINWKNHKEKIIPKLSEAGYAISSMVRISNIPFYYKIWSEFFFLGGRGVTIRAVRKFSLYKRKLSELWLVHNPEPPVGHLNN